MPRRSRRTISDDIHCINNNNSSCCAIDFSSKNVFFIRLSLFFLCFWPIIMAKAAILMDDTNPNDFLSILGLPRKNHCAIYYNNALFILKGQSIESSLAITFINDSFLASSTQFPSIQWIENNNNNNNKNDSNVQQQQQESSASICTVTSYGQAIIFHPTTYQTNDTIDLNTMNWTLTLSSSSSSSSSPPPPTNFTTVAATIMKDDTILVLGHNNNNTLSTWILDASDNQLQWTWTQLTSPFSFLLRNENSTLISVSMTTTTSYILYFGVNQRISTTTIPTSIDLFYDVSVYCFDISSLTWMGSLLNFTSTTNHIQSVMINNNNNNNNNNNINSNNDTLLIIPDWIDTTIIHATSSDINVTNDDAAAGKKNQQIQQQWRWQYQQLPNGTLSQSQGFWILNIDATSSSSSLPWIDFVWQPSSSNFDSISGGSATLVGDTVVFYGGENVTRGTPSLTSSINTGTDSSSTGGMNFELRFWNISDHSFLATPAWLAPFLISSSPPTLSPSPNAADTNSNDNNKVIIILGTLLGLFGLAFLCVLGLLLWRRKKQQQQRQNDEGTRQLEEEQGTSMTADQHNDTPIRIEGQHDNAATWAEHLHRSFSAILQRLRPTTSSAAAATKRKIPTVAGMAISAPLIADPPPMMNTQQPQQQQPQDDNDESQHTVPSPTSTSPVAPPPPPMSSSNLTNSAPQSTRNSWREGSLKASRFVEHF